MSTSLAPERIVNSYRIAWGIFFLALLVRLGVLGLTFPGNNSVYYYDDAKIALNMIEGNGYSISYQYRNWLFYESVLKNADLRDPVMEGTRTTAVKQPAYPLLLAGLFYCFGAKNFFVVFVLHAIISALTAVLLFVALKSYMPVAAGIATLVVMFYPPFAFHSMTAPESTTLLLFLISALLLLLVQIKKQPATFLFAGVGAVAGVAVLTEPVTLPFAGVGLCYAFILDNRTVLQRLRAFALSVVVAALVVSPWLARNYIVFDRFPVFKSGLGLVFNWGLHFSGRGSWIPDNRMLALEQAGRNLSEIEEDEAIRRELRSRFPEHWQEYVFQDIPRHFAHLWWDVPRYWDNYSLAYLLGRRIPYLFLFALAVPSLFRLLAGLLRERSAVLRKRVPEMVAFLLICNCTLLYSLFGSFHSRYRLPVELALVVFASLTLQPFVTGLFKGRLRSYVPSAFKHSLAPGVS